MRQIGKREEAQFTKRVLYRRGQQIVKKQFERLFDALNFPKFCKIILSYKKGRIWKKLFRNTEPRNRSPFASKGSGCRTLSRTCRFNFKWLSLFRQWLSRYQRKKVFFLNLLFITYRRFLGTLTLVFKDNMSMRSHKTADHGLS